MKIFIHLFFLCLFCLSSFAQGLPETEVFGSLTVTWIDENTVQVSGYGNGGGDYTNSLGSCTNCLAISPDEMHDIKKQILDKIVYTLDDIHSIYLSCDVLDNSLSLLGDEISSFRRFGDYPDDDTMSGSYRAAFTSYVYTVNNTQTFLDRSVDPGIYTSATMMRLASYNNGIYDYATQYVVPSVSEMKSQVFSIHSSSTSAETKLNSIDSIVRGITEESCRSCGGGTNTFTSCPCEEQWVALLDYVRHIDDDQHKRHVQLNQISNNVFNLDKQFDSYAKLVSGVLYQDGTIVVDDGENSWSNVYSRGYSELYDYDKSNILQRIELLLFGVSYNTSTNWGNSVESVEDTSDELEEKFSRAEDTLREQSESLKDDVELIQEKFTTFVNRLNFFGAGHLGEFSLIDPITVFDVYTFDVDSAGFASDLGNLQQVSRTCFQVFYWVSAVLFMVWFWWSFIRFVIDHVFTLVKFFNNLLT